MPATIDAIVLAGDKGGSKHFEGRNKTLLDIAGKPSLAYVIDALDRASRVSRIVVVGPADEIGEIVTRYGWAQRDVVVLEQRETIYENFWVAFLELLGPDYSPGLEESDPDIAMKPVLLVPGDTPFLGPDELDEFLGACLQSDLDYGVGMTEERFLERFYPVAGKPGIKMTYMHLSNGSFRLNNLHFARPFRILNRAYVEQIYESRYQKDLRNILRVVRDVVTTKGLGLRPLLLYGQLLLAVLFDSIDARRSLAWIRKRITPEKITRTACILLKGNVGIVETTGGGAAIDIDNEADYETIALRYDEFVNT